ncbi:hypothetical protein [Actinoplanes philippinensis]|uniref:AbiJ-related protein n=1 Tax=Actinoplanes philippinensis TaxID=35752 RepID=UPI0033D9A31D
MTVGYRDRLPAADGLPVPEVVMARHITDVTRRRLLKGLTELVADPGSVPDEGAFAPTRYTGWSGVLDEMEFLTRLYDLEALPSTDDRFDTAGRDIAQHRIFNWDWRDDNWVFTYEPLGLAEDDELLLAFLAEMLHPAVRTDLAEVERLRDFLNSVLVHDGYELVQVDEISGAPIFGTRRIGAAVPGRIKNLIFAAVGPKPEIVLTDALDNDLKITANEQGCLMYDRRLTSRGLTWAELTAWWADRQHLDDLSSAEVARDLYRRLDQSLGSNNAERRVLRAYASRYVRLGPDIPALIPQVYLHFDPLTQAHYVAGEGPLQRQRMDFLLLLPHGARIVIEVDGKQHYADGEQASPQRYAAMMAEDRELRLRGYELYRFGGAELVDAPGTMPMLEDFFDRLLDRHAR